MRPPPWPFIREVCLFVMGAAGLAYQLLGTDSPDPSLSLIFAAMLGLPIMLRKDDK